MKIDVKQRNINCRFCGDKEETINHILSECSKLAQREYETRYDRVRKLIHWEPCKQLKLNHTTKWDTHNPEFILEKETHEIHWDFKIQTAHLIPNRKPNLVLTKK